jgi:hypothetical protein
MEEAFGAEVIAFVDWHCRLASLKSHAQVMHRELLTHPLLGPIFRERLVRYARDYPKAEILPAYADVALSVRRDFLPTP